jgi:hypothetical protein
MKKIIFIIYLGVFFSFLLSAQESSSESFYYYDGKKVFLQKKTDKICLKFAPNAGKEQLRTLIDREVSLQPTSDTYLEDGSLRNKSNQKFCVNDATFFEFCTSNKIKINSLKKS